MKAQHGYFMQLALQNAMKSDHKVFKHGAVLIYRSKVISNGHNTGYSHAERSCIENCSSEKIKNCTLYVVRINKKREYRLSKPCCECTKFIQRYDIKKTYYSIN
jgi:deoxycytidylate deaminase